MESDPDPDQKHKVSAIYIYKYKYEYIYVIDSNAYLHVSVLDIYSLITEFQKQTPYFTMADEIPDNRPILLERMSTIRSQHWIR